MGNARGLHNLSLRPIIHTMDPIKETTEERSILNDTDLIISLDQNIVPEPLAERLKYSRGGLNDGTSREVYLDTKTGDTYVSGNAMGGLYVVTYRIVTTKVGEYKWLSYHGGSGYMGSEYFLNGIEITKSHLFYQILQEQKALPE